jgi:hypothetical protein
LTEKREFFAKLFFTSESLRNLGKCCSSSSERMPPTVNAFITHFRVLKHLRFFCDVRDLAGRAPFGRAARSPLLCSFWHITATPSSKPSPTNPRPHNTPFNSHPTLTIILPKLNSHCTVVQRVRARPVVPSPPNGWHAPRPTFAPLRNPSTSQTYNASQTLGQRQRIHPTLTRTFPKLITADTSKHTHGPRAFVTISSSNGGARHTTNIRCSS